MGMNILWNMCIISIQFYVLWCFAKLWLCTVSAAHWDTGWGKRWTKARCEQWGGAGLGVHQPLLCEAHWSRGWMSVTGNSLRARHSQKSSLLALNPPGCVIDVFHSHWVKSACARKLLPTEIDLPSPPSHGHCPFLESFHKQFFKAGP